MLIVKLALEREILDSYLWEREVKKHVLPFIITFYLPHGIPYAKKIVILYVKQPFLKRYSCCFRLQLRLSQAHLMHIISFKPLPVIYLKHILFLSMYLQEQAGLGGERVINKHVRWTDWFFNGLVLLWARHYHTGRVTFLFDVCDDWWGALMSFSLFEMITRVSHLVFSKPTLCSAWFERRLCEGKVWFLASPTCKPPTRHRLDKNRLADMLWR